MHITASQPPCAFRRPARDGQPSAPRPALHSKTLASRGLGLQVTVADGVDPGAEIFTSRPSSDSSEIFTSRSTEPGRKPCPIPSRRLGSESESQPASESRVSVTVTPAVLRRFSASHVTCLGASQLGPGRAGPGRAGGCVLRVATALVYIAEPGVR